MITTPQEELTYEIDDAQVSPDSVTDEDHTLNREGDLNPYHPFWFRSIASHGFLDLDLSEVS